MQDILYCPACRRHTMSKACSCTLTAMPVYPAKYSPQDKYASYRRKAKENERKAQGIV